MGTAEWLVNAECQCWLGGKAYVRYACVRTRGDPYMGTRSCMRERLNESSNN